LTALVSIYVIFKNIGITLPWQNTYQAEVALDNAKGIVAGEQTVRLAGVTIGRISAVQADRRSARCDDHDGSEVRPAVSQRDAHVAAGNAA
jgi:ABC-type transporter Mla subunit MlaD